MSTIAISSIIATLKLLVLVGLSILILQSMFYIRKLYKFAAYKNAELASEKYLESRLLVGIKGKDISKIATQLDDYLNDVIGVDLNEDELICIVESKIWRTLHDNKINSQYIESANIIANGLRDGFNQQNNIEPEQMDSILNYNNSEEYIEECDNNSKDMEDYFEMGYDEIIGGIKNDN